MSEGAFSFSFLATGTFTRVVSPFNFAIQTTTSTRPTVILPTPHIPPQIFPPPIADPQPQQEQEQES
jgi:hypothetical protein